MSNSTFFALWFLVPFLSGLGLTLFLRALSRWGSLWAALAGVVLAFGIVLSIYLSSPRTYPAGSETELYLGRYWEPQFVGIIFGWGFVFWLMGAGVGAAVAAVCRRRSFET